VESPVRLLPPRLLASLLALSSTACFAHQFRTKPRVAVVDGDPIVQMKPASKVASLVEPRFVGVGEHTDPPAPWEPIIGVPASGSPRGYPVGLLDRYEVVDVAVKGSSYVVARCALTQISAVYDRVVGGRTLTFVNSGALWRDTLVLKDLETGTLWSAANGRALYGPLEGERLRQLPAILGTSRAWHETFPDALCLDTGETTERPLMMSLYSASPWQGISGVRTEDGRYEPKTEVFTVAEGSEALAFTEEELKKLGPVRRSLAGRPVSLEWDTGLAAPRAFRLDDGCAELAIVPMYWFAADRHFETVRTAFDAGASSAALSSR
jgi:Protein of unknown function (DUF3179)